MFLLFFLTCPSENDRKNEFSMLAHDEELDELCTQHHFKSWSQRLARVEVGRKPVSAKSARQTGSRGYLAGDPAVLRGVHDGVSRARGSPGRRRR